LRAAKTALGGDAYAEIDALAPVPSHDDAGPIEALVRNALSIGCLSETVAVALISAERLRSGPAVLEQALSGILADEVQHAKLGWDLLESLLPRLDAAARARLDAYLEVALRHLVAHELAHLPASAAPSDQASAVGVCDGMESRAIFFETVETVIVPRLVQLGLDGHGAWRRAAA
jgi:hypothetical protein